MRYAKGLLMATLVVASGAGQASAVEARGRLRVAGAQIPVSPYSSTNLAALQCAVPYAAAEKADILLTPQGSLSGCFTDFDAARTAAGLERITAAARKSGVALALGTCFDAILLPHQAPRDLRVERHPSRLTLPFSLVNTPLTVYSHARPPELTTPSQPH